MSQTEEEDIQSLLDNKGPAAVWFCNVNTSKCVYAHKISRQETRTFAVHEHNECEILYIVSGEVEFFIAGTTHSIAGGTVVLIPPHVKHGVMVKNENPYERYTLHFAIDTVSVSRRIQLFSIMPELLTGPSSYAAGNSAIFPDAESSGIMHMMEMFKSLEGLTDEIREQLVPIYVEGVLASLVGYRALNTERVDKLERRLPMIQKVIAWVDQHYTEKLTLERIADQFFLSKGYLNRQFKETTGYTVKEFVNGRRLAYAHLLLSSGENPAQVAEKSGFSDYTTFYRNYTRAYGHAPSEDQVEEVNPQLVNALNRMETIRQERNVFTTQEEKEAACCDDDPSMSGAVYMRDQGVRSDNLN